MNDSRLDIDWKERTIDVDKKDFTNMEHLYDTIYFYWSCNVRTYHGKGVSKTPPMLRCHEKHHYKMNGFTLYINSGEKLFTFTDDFELDEFDFKSIDKYETRFHIDWEQKIITVPDVSKFFNMKMLYEAIHGYWEDVVVAGGDILGAPSLPIKRLGQYTHEYEMQDGFQLHLSLDAGRPGFTLFTEQIKIDKFDFMKTVESSEWGGATLAKPRVLHTFNDDAARVALLIEKHFTNAPIQVGNMLFWIEQFVYPMGPLSSKKDSNNFRYNALCRHVDGIHNTLVAGSDLANACSILSFTIKAIELETGESARIGDGNGQGC